MGVARAWAIQARVRKGLAGGRSAFKQKLAHLFGAGQDDEVLGGLIELADDASPQEKATAVGSRFIDGILGAPDPEEAAAELARLVAWQMPPDLRAALEREPSNARRLLAQLMPFRASEKDEFTATLVRHLLKHLGRA